MKQKPVRVLIVEDSAFMRLQLKSFLEKDERFDIVGEARDGEEALKLVEALRPDVITLDIELPKKDGIEVLSEVMERFPTPVVIVSVLAKESADVTLKALSLGAVDFITKPTPTHAARLKEEFPMKLYYASKAKLNRLKSFSADPPADSAPRSFSSEGRIVVIGASIGGPQTLHYLLPQFPKEFPAPIVVIQHMPKIYTPKFTQTLAKRCKLNAKEAAPNERPAPGTIYVAPGGSHLLFTSSGRFALDDGPPVNSVKPALDVTLVSAARTFKDKVIGVVLTGMGRDGADGAGEVKRQGGLMVAETEASCVVYGMSRSVIESGFCDYPLALERIGPFLLEKLECRTV